MSRQAFQPVAALFACAALTFAQAPGGRGGGIPNSTPEQTAAVAQMNTDLAALTQSLAAARTAVVAASLAVPRNNAAIQGAVGAVQAAEISLASARATAFAKLQASPNKLAADQVPALATNAGGAGRGGGGAAGRGAGGGARGGTTFPHATAKQAKVLLAMTAALATQTQALNDARAAVAAAAYSEPANAAIKAKIDAVGAAETALASARADAFAKIQASADKLDAEQLAYLVAGNGNYPQTNGLEGEPYDFNDHRGYVSLFDGVSLKGWDGNPKFWRAEGGAIIGESTPTNPSGNSYIAYRDMVAKISL